MRFVSWLLALALIGCLHQKGSAPEPAPTLDIPTIPHSPTAPVNPNPDIPDASEDKKPHFSFVEQDNYLFIKFDAKVIPKGTFFIEATYGDEYLGYFVLNDTIVVKKPEKGSKVLLYYVLDGLGNRLLQEPYTAILP